MSDPAELVPAALPVAAPAPAPVVRYLSDKPRQTSIVLDWPVAIGDTEYREIYVRRMNAREVGTFMEAYQAAPKGATVRFPMFTDAQGTLIPDLLWDVLDDDDAAKLNEAVASFLPARFRTVTTKPNSTPANGDTTAPSSDESPVSA